MRSNLLLILLLSTIYIAVAQQYVRSQSLEYIIYSDITHCQPQKILNWSCNGCKAYSSMQDTKYIQNNLTHIVGFMGYHAKRNAIVIAWRGTIDTRNWIQDGEFVKVPYPCEKCQIHSGFYLSYLSVQYQVVPYVQKIWKDHPDAKIIVTGHSLGGALATICALQLQRKFGKVSILHNFGSPRVGNSYFANYVRSKIQTSFRVVHNQDLVPHLPPQQLGFHHHAYQVFYGQNMSQQYKICDPSGEDPNCSNMFFPNYTMADHGSYFGNETRHYC